MTGYVGGADFSVAPFTLPSTRGARSVVVTRLHVIFEGAFILESHHKGSQFYSFQVSFSGEP